MEWVVLLIVIGACLYWYFSRKNISQSKKQPENVSTQDGVPFRIEDEEIYRSVIRKMEKGNTNLQNPDFLEELYYKMLKFFEAASREVYDEERKKDLKKEVNDLNEVRDKYVRLQAKYNNFPTEKEAIFKDWSDFILNRARIQMEENRFFARWGKVEDSEKVVTEFLRISKDLQIKLDEINKKFDERLNKDKLKSEPA